MASTPDLLIRDFPEDLDLLDEQARRLGLSRVEYLRRQLHQTARRLDSEVTVADLRNLADLIGDLDEESVMTRAWSSSDSMNRSTPTRPIAEE